ncbi:putative acyltransferase [Kineococcus xinjiangensis]|uniref:Putative acyltransferase n=1 Tax=Kineococcus xinjiangensis TaxID=512762 RepID=A0A2S6IH36_9ACTN|nr:heparan-alpha-glucosaminide N-acetyltransferase domain-containing protein [Kineococcus xinjiangensis]PPK93535.1 putative acyltransferase [Kineococcus xinjiangensis]
MKPQGAASGGTTTTGPARITSLDWVRGWMLVASVAVNSLWWAPEWFEHAHWAGVHPVDLVFPVFVALSGCGLALAMHRRVQVRPMLRRVLVLLAVGLLYNAVTTHGLDTRSWDPATWRLPGVLQLYAVLVTLVALGHLLTRTWRGWALLTAAAATAHTALLAGWAAGCPGGELTRECNPSGGVDTAVFGAAHVYAAGQAGHDPEGLVAIGGALVSAAAGATTGHLLLARRAARPPGRGPGTAVLPVLGLAAALLAAAVLTSQAPAWLGAAEVPAMKRLWTAPFALGVGAGVALALLAGHLLLDRARTGAALRASAWPLVALGRNSLLVYFGSHVVMALLLERPEGAPDGPSTAERAANAVAVAGHPQATWTVLAVLAWTALACLLHSRRLYLRP